MNRSTLKFAGLIVAILSCNEAGAWSHASGFGRTSGGGGSWSHSGEYGSASGGGGSWSGESNRGGSASGGSGSWSGSGYRGGSASGGEGSWNARDEMAGLPPVAEGAGTVRAPRVERLRVVKVHGMPRVNMVRRPAAITRTVMARPLTVRLSPVRVGITPFLMARPTIIRPPLSLPTAVAITVVITRESTRQPRLRQAWWRERLSRRWQTRMPTTMPTEQGITRAWSLPRRRQCP